MIPSGHDSLRCTKALLPPTSDSLYIIQPFVDYTSLPESKGIEVFIEGNLRTFSSWTYKIKDWEHCQITL